MKRIILLPLLVVALYVNAKEGMWLPYLLQKLNAPEMQTMGMKISAEEIFSVNKSSLKDAIVLFGGGCTAEIVSKQGLILTNHHCGYGEIQAHSSIEHDYLTDGFWATTFNDELANPGLQVMILERMDDVTSDVLSGVDNTMTEKQRDAAISNNIKKLTQDYAQEKFLKVEVKAFFYGNQYIMMVSKIFKDVRLVGAPPSNIGKFGGDTDNWMWPRHTGDFSVFRIYADENNNPAEYSQSNRPYEPANHLKISLQGYDEGDFTMVFGYPGTTKEYISSYAVDLITSKVNPFAIELRRQKLDIMSNYMQIDNQIRIQYSAKYAGVANGWKKWIGENNGIKRLNTIEIKKQSELQFTEWASGNMPEAVGLMDAFKQIYPEYEKYQMAFTYFVEAGYQNEIIRFAFQFYSLVELIKKKETTQDQIDQIKKKFLASAEGFYKDYNSKVDKELFVAAIKAYSTFSYDVSAPKILDVIKNKYSGDVSKYSEFVYSKSMFDDKDVLISLIKNITAKDIKKIEKDPMYLVSVDIYSNFINNIRDKYYSFDDKIDSLQRIYMAGQMRKSESQLYPDANSTLRIAYGNVSRYYPRDGVEYNYFTTLDGIMQKENPEIYDYVVEKKLKQLYQSKDYGRYADKSGKMNVCFIASNHTTGGNSGSPVLNANGELIGINFDRNWEGTMSDLDYDPDQCRNIMLDIRYCLFIIDKFAEASRLVEEMEIR